MRLRKHFFKNNSLAAHLGGGASSQGGGEQGTGARGSHYLDGSTRSHTIAAKGIVFEVRSGPKHWPFLIPSLNKNSLTDCPYFRSKRRHWRRRKMPPDVDLYLCVFLIHPKNRHHPNMPCW